MYPTVTHGARDSQARPYTGSNDANSQADSAGSIPVTRSTVEAQARTLVRTRAFVFSGAFKVAVQLACNWPASSTTPGSPPSSRLFLAFSAWT